MAEDHVLIASFDHVKSALLDLVYQLIKRSEFVHVRYFPSDNSSVAGLLSGKDLTNPFIGAGVAAQAEKSLDIFPAQGIVAFH